MAQWLERREGCWRQRGIKETVKECVEAEGRTAEEERNVTERNIRKEKRGKKVKDIIVQTSEARNLESESTLNKKVRKKLIIK